MVLLSVVTSAYNEEEGIIDFLKECDKLKIPGVDVEFVVVDNGARDKTGKLIDAFSKTHKRFRAFHNAIPTKGMGAGYIRAFKEARGEYVAIIRSDWQENPQDIAKLFTQLKKQNLDCIIGWRKERHDPAFRLFTSWIYNFCANVLYGFWQPDINGAPKIFKKKFIKGYAFQAMQPFIDVELLALIKHRGGTIASYPAKHLPRKKGTSHVRWQMAYTMLSELFLYKFKLKFD